MIKVWWTNEERNADMDCGEFETEAEARAALPAIKQELLDCCPAGDEEVASECRETTLNGRFDAEDLEDPDSKFWRLAYVWEVGE